MPNPTLLILAAGMGSRYGGLKQIDPVGPDGETIMDYSIFDALRAGFGKVVFVIRKDIEEPFRQIIGARYENRIAVDYVFQELDNIEPGFSVPAGRTKPWGTAQAVLSAAGAIHEPFAVINADDFYGAEGYRLLAGHFQSNSAEYAMVGYTLRNTLSEFGSVARGVCTVDEHGYLLDVVEHTSVERTSVEHTSKATLRAEAEGRQLTLTGDEIVSLNFWGFAPSVFALLREQFQEFLRAHGNDPKAECYLPSVVNQIMHAGAARVRVLRGSDAWFGVTYRDDRPRVVENVRQLIAAGSYPNKLWR